MSSKAPGFGDRKSNVRYCYPNRGQVISRSR